MPTIQTVYLVAHVHTDIGYTDHQDVLFRQHLDFIDRAIELCEATADYPPEARFHWTCEIASTVEQYVRQRPPAQVDRFLKLNREGRIAVSAMAYHWTPLLSPTAMVRSLYPAMRLRREYGVRVDFAMQSDVDGVSWLWADLLPAIGVEGLTMAINPHRGVRPTPDLLAFWWEGPGGGRLFTFSGPHYAYGVFFYGMGDLRRAEKLLTQAVRRLEAREDYPYDFLYAPTTHPARADNGPPYAALSDFVRAWNAEGRQPRIVFTTPGRFLAMVRQHYGATAPTWRGDWTDWWADGVASSAYETALSRLAEAMLPTLDLLAAQVDGLDTALIEEAYRNLYLYDEHTWGAYSSITLPHHPFTRAQWNRKAGFAYTGYALTHHLLAEGGRKLARAVTGRSPEGDVWPAPRHEEEMGEDEDRFLVINSLGWTRTFALPLPPRRRGHAPYNFLEAAFQNYRDPDPTQGMLTRPQVAEARLPPLRGTLPAFGYRVIAPDDAPPPDGVRRGEGWMENRWYRVRIDPRTGGLRSWWDKAQERELADVDGPWRLGQYVYEWVDDPRGRKAIFTEDFAREGYGIRQRGTPFRRGGAEAVEVGPVQADGLGLRVEVRLQAPGARSVRVRYTLPHHEKALYLDMVVDKRWVTEPEAVYILFPFALEAPRFHLDLNGVPLTPEAEQLPGTCRDWYGVQRWAEVGDGRTSVVLVPLDAPLVQLGGIQTGRWAAHLEAEQATLVSWAAHNHWSTNFRAAQSGELLFRYRLTTLPRYDAAAAGRFAAEHLVPPVVVRVPGAEVGREGRFLEVEPEGVADVQLKRAEDGRGIILRAFNLTTRPQRVSVAFPAVAPRAAWACSPVEEDGDPLPVEGQRVRLSVPSRSLASARVVFA